MVTIRPEREEDRAAVRAVHEAAFPTDVEARLVDALRAGGNALVSLVAEVQGRVVGHVLFSPVSVEPALPGVAGAGLAPVAVLPAYQRQGIGARLIESGIAACRELGLGFVVVLGDPGYYQRFGFTRAGAFGLGNEYGVDEEFMALELRPGCLSGACGVVRYSAEFAAFGE
jgi:putative acetyltransferase